MQHNPAKFQHETRRRDPALLRLVVPSRGARHPEVVVAHTDNEVLAACQQAGPVLTSIPFATSLRPLATSCEQAGMTRIFTLPTLLLRPESMPNGLTP